MNLIESSQISAINCYQIVLHGSAIKSLVYIIDANTHIYISYFPHDFEVRMTGNHILSGYDFIMISKYSFNRVKKLILKHINKDYEKENKFQ